MWMAKRLLKIIELAISGELPIQKAVRHYIGLKLEIPPRIVYDYAKGVSKITGLSLREVLRSQPVRRFWQKLTEY